MKYIKKVVLAITTYNRLDYLKNCIETWNQYRNQDYSWYLIIADDGSEDGTIEYIKNLHIENVHKHVILNNRTGVGYQTNKILRYCSELDFDYGFKIDDDLIFLKKNWDTSYIVAIEATGYDHLCFFDVEWHKGFGGEKYRLDPLLSKEGKLQSFILPEVKETQGAFWTFTKRIIDKVGYFDPLNFGFSGLEHIDYTYRCARAGFNELDNIYDCLNSKDYIKLIKDDYISALSMNLVDSFNTSQILSYKRRLINKVDRIFVDYIDDPTCVGCITNKDEIIIKDSIVFVLPPNKRLEDLEYLKTWLDVLLEKGYKIQIFNYVEDKNYEENILTNGIKVFTVNSYSLKILNSIAIDSFVLIDYSMISLFRGVNSKRKILIINSLDFKDSIDNIIFSPHIELTTMSNSVESYYKSLSYNIKLIENKEDILSLFLYRMQSDLKNK